MNHPIKKMSYEVAQSTTILTIFSFLSPLAGLVLEMVIAWRFGAVGTIDAFRVGSLLLLFGNQIFFGQMLPHVIVPLILKYRESESEQEGWRFAITLSEIFGMFSLTFVFWTWFNSDVLIRLMAPGLSGATKIDAIFFVRWFSFVFLLMAWSGIMSGMLYTYRVFWLSSASQFISNVLVISSIFLVGQKWGDRSLVLGIMMGSLIITGLHVFLILKYAKKSNVSLLACLRLGPWEGIKTAMLLSIPLLGLIIIDQWGVVILNRVLSGMVAGTISKFGYAWKLQMLVGLLPANLATVIFPEFSKAHVSKNLKAFSRLATRGIRVTLFLTIPLGVVLFIIRIPLVGLIFERGAMTNISVVETGQLFGVFLFLAPAGALTAILYKVAFSLQDTKSPAMFGLISAFLITVLVPYSAQIGGEMGVAWVLSAITWVNTLSLLTYLIWRYHLSSIMDIIRYFILLLAVSFGVGLSTIIIKGLFEINAPLGISMELIEITLVVLISVFVGFGLSKLLGIEESSEILNFIRWQFNKIRFNN